MRKKFYVLLLAIACCASCAINGKVDEQPKKQAAESTKATGELKSAETAKTETINSANSGKTANKKDVFDEIKVTKTDCANVDVGDNAVMAKQTFPVDFAPFANSCFVTSYNPEYDDPPLESEFAIYKDGAKIFDFPGQFNGVEFGCWVEAAAFEDLNNDNLKDVIVAGMCSAKSAPYSENMVYVNTGKAFTTDENANSKLADFKRIRDITDFVRKNQQIYFK
ncbi:MAG: hypothetical protein M3Q99_02075 [Acidobacteriota bacterium]|nr:hypothetical protein [Acidobacteriota bacterium]